MLRHVDASTAQRINDRAAGVCRRIALARRRVHAPMARRDPGDAAARTAHDNAA
jgi:hypothetical protein